MQKTWFDELSSLEEKSEKFLRIIQSEKAKTPQVEESKKELLAAIERVKNFGGGTNIVKVKCYSEYFRRGEIYFTGITSGDVLKKLAFIHPTWVVREIENFDPVKLYYY